MNIRSRTLDEGISSDPHNIEAEEGLLACCLSYDSADIVSKCVEEKVSSSMFFKVAHQHLFEAIIDMHSKGKPIDEIVLLDHLRKSGMEEDVGGIAAIYSIQSRVESTLHHRYFISIIKEKAALRSLIRLSRETIESALDQSVDSQSLTSSIETKAREIADGTNSCSTVETSKDIAQRARATLLDKLNNPDRETDVIETQMTDLNDALPCGGFWDGDLVVLAARPSIGKTALAMNIAEHASIENGKDVLVFSFEMLSDNLINRVAASNAGISSRDIQEACISASDYKKLDAAYNRVEESGLYIESDKTLDVFGIRSRALQMHNKLKHRGGLDLVIVDYLQLIKGSDPRMMREQQIAEMSRTLKILADELKCPVIALSQLNRDSEKNDRRPRMSDLRESGAIEQDASTVILLHRVQPEGEYPDPLQDHVEIILAKVREGETSTVDSKFVKRYTKFENKRGF